MELGLTTAQVPARRPIRWTRMLPIIFALAPTLALLYGVAEFAADTRLGDLLLHRGWTQPLTLALFFWGLGHTLRRWLVQLGETRAANACRNILRDEVLDRERLPHLIGALYPYKESLAGPVVSSVLSYFRGQRPTRDEVLKVADQALDRAYDRVDGDYKPLSACLWLLPLSGFLGTVIGMAGAVGSFDGILANGADLSALAPALSGLATAFDTTLLALALVMPLKLLEVWLEGRDRHLLEEIDRTLGAGMVRELDLAVLAQKSLEEEASDRFADALDRIGDNLRQIDRVLGSITLRVQELPAIEEAVDALVQAADAARVHLPELKALREQGEQPILIQRKP